MNPVIIYATPQSSMNYFNTCSKHLSNLSDTCLPTIVVGDFNLPDINWETLSGGTSISNQFCEQVFDLNMNQLVDQPTHMQGNTSTRCGTNQCRTFGTLSFS